MEVSFDTVFDPRPWRQKLKQHAGVNPVDDLAFDLALVIDDFDDPARFEKVTDGRLDPEDRLKRAMAYWHFNREWFEDFQNEHQRFKSIGQGQRFLDWLRNGAKAPEASHAFTSVPLANKPAA